MSTPQINSDKYQSLLLNNTNKKNFYKSDINPDITKNDEISKLQVRIKELKERQKEHFSLNQRYKQLLSEYSKLNEDKKRLEYEIKQRELEYNRHISDLNCEKQSLQLGLNDKLINSKKICSENNLLEKELELKDNDIDNLNMKLSDLSHQLDAIEEYNINLTKNLENLNKEFINQKNQIIKLKQDNICLTKICQDNEYNKRSIEKDILELHHQIDEYNYDLGSLGKNDECYKIDINNLQKKLNNVNDINIDLQNKIKKLEKEFDDCRNENDMIKNELLNIRTLRVEKETLNDKLTIKLMDKDRKIKALIRDNDHQQIMNKEKEDKNYYYKNNNDKLKKQINILEKQNNDLINEIDNVIKDDKKMKEVISRKNRITSLLRDNNQTLEKSINDLDKYINSSSNNLENQNNRTNNQMFIYQDGNINYI